jgi:serine/threonine-protein kinase
MAIWEKVLPAARRVFGQRHSTTLRASGSLASAYESIGQWARAEPLRREISARRREVAGPDSPAFANDLAALGVNLLRQAKWSEAEPVLRECLAIRERVRADDWSRFDVMSLLGGCLLGQGRLQEAEAPVVGGYRGLKAREARMPRRGCGARLREAAKRVLRLYEAWGRPDQARAWAARLGLADLPADVFAPR